MKDIVDKANELYREYKKYAEEKYRDSINGGDFAYGAVRFCAQKIEELEEKHKAEIAELNKSIDVLNEQIHYYIETTNVSQKNFS